MQKCPACRKEGIADSARIYASLLFPVKCTKCVPALGFVIANSAPTYVNGPVFTPSYTPPSIADETGDKLALFERIRGRFSLPPFLK